MPDYYVGFATVETAVGYDLFSTASPACYIRYECNRPYETFPELPADYFRMQEVHYRTDEELIDYVQKSGAPYSYWRIYRNYDQHLDVQIDYQGGYYEPEGYTAVYRLTMPPRPAAIPADELYPQWKYWYYAIARSFHRYLRHADFLNEQAYDSDGNQEIYAIGDVPSIGS